MKTTVLAAFVLAVLAGVACNKQEETEKAAPSAVAVAAPPPVATVKPEVEEPAAEPPKTDEAKPEEATEAKAAEPSAAPVQRTSTTKTAAAAAPSASAAQASAPNTSGYTAIQRCCVALDEAANKGGLSKNKYAAASAVCKGLAQQVKKGAANPTSAKTTLRAQLQGVPIPGGC